MDGQRRDGQDHVDGVQSIEADVGEEIDVVLADLPGAGYEWVAREVPVGLVRLTPDRVDPPPSEPGASRLRTFRFAARTQGSYDLGFDLVRPWEPPDVAPARQHRVAVVVGPGRGRE